MQEGHTKMEQDQARKKLCGNGWELEVQYKLRISKIHICVHVYVYVPRYVYVCVYVYMHVHTYSSGSAC